MPAGQLASRVEYISKRLPPEDTVVAEDDGAVEVDKKGDCDLWHDTHFKTKRVDDLWV